MTFKQWVRFGVLRQRMIWAGYCPLHGKEFEACYLKEQECETCIKNRQEREIAERTIAGKRRHERARNAYEEMLRLANL